MLDGALYLFVLGNQLSLTSVICVLQAFIHPLSNQQPVMQHQLPVQHAHPHTPYEVQQNPARLTHMTVNTHHAMHTPPATSENIAAPAPPTVSGPAQPPQPLAVFERIIDRLSSMFPHYSRSDLHICTFVLLLEIIQLNHDA